MADRLIFCDFDGTILVEEIFRELLTHFAPEPAARILPEILALRVSLREGLSAILGTIPSHRWPEMESFVQENSHLRAGFMHPGKPFALAIPSRICGWPANAPRSLLAMA